jgi:RND superfamily putative drug exporter
VVLAVVIGHVTGTTTLTGAQSGSGESGRADVVLDDAGFPDPPMEQVLVQTRDGSAIGPAGTSAANAVAAAVRSLDEVASVGDPVPAADGTSLLVPVTLQVGDATGAAAGDDGAARRPDLVAAAMAAPAAGRQLLRRGGTGWRIVVPDR